MNPTDRAEELNILVRARYPILYILSWEERRIEKILGQVAEDRRKKLYGWSITDGLTHWRVHDPGRSWGKPGESNDICPRTH